MSDYPRNDERRNRSVADKRASLAGAAGRGAQGTRGVQGTRGAHSAGSGGSAAKRPALSDAASAASKRGALAGGEHRAYSHGSQVGGSRVRLADGRWVDRPREEAPQREKRPPVSKMTLGQFVRYNLGYILSVAAVVAVVVLVIGGARFLLGGSQQEETSLGPITYDWSNLSSENGRFAYVMDDQVKSRFGIDVAEYQDEIDWNAAARDGVEFAIVRLGYRGATEGELYLDGRCFENLEGARAAGIDCGVYFFSQAITVEEAAEEAEFVLEHLGGMQLQYPVAFDSEVVTTVNGARTAPLSDEQLTAIADAFCDRVEAAGYETLVYGNAIDLRSYDMDALTGRGIWWAQYDVAHPSHDADIVIWQFTSSGEVDGVPGLVDMDLDLLGAVR